MLFNSYDELTLVLLSLVDHAWKISDFGLTSEGTSMRAYTTHHARGTTCYRAPELVRERPLVSKNSDIWSLGCILYELASGRKAFRNDWAVREYSFSKQKLDIPVLQVDARLKAYIRELIHSMLEIEWRKRPSTRDILQALASLCDRKSAVILCFVTEGMCCPGHDGKLGEFTGDSQNPQIRQVLLEKGCQNWEVVRWVPCW